MAPTTGRRLTPGVVVELGVRVVGLIAFATTIPRRGRLNSSTSDLVCRLFPRVSPCRVNEA